MSIEAICNFESTYLGSDVVQLDCRDWVYRGEGGANIVYAYTGSDTQFTGKVLRLQKSRYSLSEQTSLLENGSEFEDELLEEEHVAAAEQFEENVMKPLIGSAYFCSSRWIRISCDFIRNLAACTELDRPAKRRASTSPRLLLPIGKLIEDACVLDGRADLHSFCIEIKPKCGFVPQLQVLRRFPHIRSRVPRYTLLQTQRFITGSNQDVSLYNPLDLFSMNAQRLRRALHDLQECPQNNFRVFVDGKLSDAAVFTEMETLASILQNEGVLKRIEDVQRLDLVDVDAIQDMYNELNGNYNLNVDPSRPVSWDQLRNVDAHGQTDLAKIDLIRAFLISRTAMDLSIMICFRSATEFKIRLVDLEPKDSTRIPRYFDIEESICNAWEEFSRQYPDHPLRQRYGQQ
eukprot:ANDGO_01961.mRNA.1 Inositol-pentakisphosphate 2-kinase IPK1